MKRKFKLNDKWPGNKDKFISGEIEIDNDTISARFDGFGTKDTLADLGHPIFIEYYNGELRLLVYDNINEQEPIVIPMTYASVDYYKEQDNESKD